MYTAFTASPKCCLRTDNSSFHGNHFYARTSFYNSTFLMCLREDDYRSHDDKIAFIEFTLFSTKLLRIDHFNFHDKSFLDNHSSTYNDAFESTLLFRR